MKPIGLFRSPVSAFSRTTLVVAGLGCLLFIPLSPGQETDQPYASVRKLSAEEAGRRSSAPVISDAAPVQTPSDTTAFSQRERLRRALAERPRIAATDSPTWQNRYTLGPGDTLNFSMYDRTDLSRSGVPIAPDGTISYLQAVSVQARGKTIPELRQSIEKSLSAYHRDPKVILTPALIGSKRYTIIGRVREPGSFQLNRPTTILEGIAAAQGIEVGTVNGNAFELADLERSFVARRGQKLDVDLAKLYHRGEIQQNAFLEPDDYIYVASSLRNEIYVLGEVNEPGRLKLANGPMTVTHAILEAGSFTPEAFKHNILLIRGSIHSPETQIVSVKDVLKGKVADTPVKNRDIIFVSKRPFQIIEKALDSAIFTYIQTVTAEAVYDAYLDVPEELRDLEDSLDSSNSNSSGNSSGSSR